MAGVLDTGSWKEFFLRDICSISMGSKLDFINMTCDDPTVNFVGRSADNNGVAGRVDLISGIVPYKPGCLTVALGGSLGCTYLQTDYFYTSQNVSVLEFSENVMDGAKLFMSTMIMNECKYKYVAFGRELNVHIRTDFSLYLPATTDASGHPCPDWAWMENFISKYYQGPLQSGIQSPGLSLSTDTWAEFRVGNLFNLQRGKCHNSDSLDDGDDLFYVGAKKDDNGIMRRVAYQPGMVFPGNCMVFICNGAGSVGYALYQDRDFIPSGDLVIGYNKNLNPYIGLFLVPILDRERDKYSFGRKWGKYVADTIIKLPATMDAKGHIVPDWAWMEQYMRSLSYSDLLEKR